MSLMKQCVWITASLAALFGLQGSLCAVACLGSASAEVASRQAADELPCHAAATGSMPAPSQPDSDPGCDCEASVVALTEDAEATTTNLAAGSLPPRGVRMLALHGVSTGLHPDPAARLPAPDILLLKSTLII